MMTGHFKIFLGGVRTNRMDQNAPHDFLCIPQLWEIHGICEMKPV